MRCTGFSSWWLLLLRSTGSRREGFSSCSTWTQWLWRTGLVAPWHVGSSWTRDRTRVPCIGRRSLLFIYFGCIGSSLLRAGPLQPRRAGATPRRGVRASHCGGLSCRGARALGTWASAAAAHGLSSCGARAQLPQGTWELPRPGIEPMSPAVAGGLSTTAPPGKSQALKLSSMTFWLQLSPLDLEQCLGYIRC